MPGSHGAVILRGTSLARPACGRRVPEASPRAEANGGAVSPKEETNGGAMSPREETNGGAVSPREEANGGAVSPREEANGGAVSPRAEANGGAVSPRAEANGGAVSPRAEVSRGVVSPKAEASGGEACPRAKPRPLGTGSEASRRDCHRIKEVILAYAKKVSMDLEDAVCHHRPVICGRCGTDSNQNLMPDPALLEEKEMEYTSALSPSDFFICPSVVNGKSSPVAACEDHWA
ncbi:hypothetical protein chiPu_0008661 [Chiloscyllium punctatum]|uniref:Uncharacterized protein n=1 Tax=Chiloscyllium punctatum TaxID=137246 RepID=A0A401SIN9_CHIPU|nr:hypothetical protein [Chiloscyllium punctatum]